ncbi:SAS complex subunit [Sporothrix epigloea]|uniref:SAS complex subunit n=1 Tax=Sporothrix epigloea TaxID=1892477 RepID=A0ABP0DTT4_9PEZI
MAPAKRKLAEDEDEAAGAEVKRDLVHQNSGQNTVLPAALKDVPSRRVLRGNIGLDATTDGTTNSMTSQGIERTQPALGTSRTMPRNISEEEGDTREQDTTEAEEEERDGGAECSPRMKRRLARSAPEQKAAELDPAESRQQSPHRQRRSGRSQRVPSSASGRTTAALLLEKVPRRTRQTDKDTDNANSDSDEAVQDETKAGGEDKEEEEDGEDDTKASPPIIPRRTRRPCAAQPVVTAAMPQSIPPDRQYVQMGIKSIPPSSTADKPSPPQSRIVVSSNLGRPKKAPQSKPLVALAPRSRKLASDRPLCPALPRQNAPAQVQSPNQLAEQTQSQNITAMHQLRKEAVPISRHQLHRQLKQPRLQKARLSRQSTIAAAASNESIAPRVTSAPTLAASLITTPTAPPSSPSQPDRNIEKVVLGEICFKAWYPSYYGKEVLGDTAGNTHPGRGNAQQAKGTSKENHHSTTGRQSQQHASGHSHGGKDKDVQPILDRLYVCPICFKYSKEIVPWHGHVQVCESNFQIPGEKIYVHPRGIRNVRVPLSPVTSSAVPTTGSKRRRVSTEADVHHVEQTVKDEGEWSIWEVDGEKDVLFCQNLSLFAKLFLDNKSVFFDVTGFYYFLLVYTPPASLPASLREATAATSLNVSSANASGQASILGAAPRPRVVGFFSKEKMSWDNNNLACILVFPPWQRKGLGALLMGISYEISRREGVLGGPEKPISDLGKKGYKRFWGAEIARWLLSIDIATATSSLSLPASPSTVPQTTAIPPPIIPPPPPSLTARSAVAGADAQQKALIIDIDDCSRATWIAREDCLYVLRDIGIVEDAGMGLPKESCNNVLTQQAPSPSSPGSVVSGAVTANTASMATTDAGSGPFALSPTSSRGAVGVLAADGAASATGSASMPAGAATGAVSTMAAAATDVPKEIQRVRISKAAVRQWVKDNRINLERSCDPAGFTKLYTNKDENHQAVEEV